MICPLGCSTLLLYILYHPIHYVQRPNTMLWNIKIRITKHRQRWAREQRKSPTRLSNQHPSFQPSSASFSSFLSVWHWYSRNCRWLFVPLNCFLWFHLQLQLSTVSIEILCWTIDWSVYSHSVLRDDLALLSMCDWTLEGEQYSNCWLIGFQKVIPLYLVFPHMIDMVILVWHLDMHMMACSAMHSTKVSSQDNLQRVLMLHQVDDSMLNIDSTLWLVCLMLECHWRGDGCYRYISVQWQAE